jgi:hypothetical protein
VAAARIIGWGLGLCVMTASSARLAASCILPAARAGRRRRGHASRRRPLDAGRCVPGAAPRACHRHLLCGCRSAPRSAWAWPDGSRPLRLARVFYLFGLVGLAASPAVPSANRRGGRLPARRRPPLRRSAPSSATCAARWRTPALGLIMLGGSALATGRPPRCTASRGSSRARLPFCDRGAPRAHVCHVGFLGNLAGGWVADWCAGAGAAAAAGASC